MTLFVGVISEQLSRLLLLLLLMMMNDDAVRV